MKFEYYYYLVRLVEEGSLAKAASLLYVSPQGLSRAIQQMNNELGVSLFYRDKNGLHLTLAGTEVYKAAKRLIEINNQLNVTLEQLKNEDPDNITLLYCASHISIAFLHKVLTEFYKKHRKAKIRLIELPLWEIGSLPEMSENEIRFVSVLETEMDRFRESLDETCSFMELGKARVLCRVSSKSNLAVKKIITPDDLKDHNIALFSAEEVVIDKILGPDLRHNVTITASNYTMLCDLISNDKSLVGITDTVIEKNLKIPSLTSVPMDLNLFTIYGYVTRRDRAVNATVSGLLDLVKKEFNGGD